MITLLARRVLMVLCAAGLLTLAACDSGGNGPPEELVGQYDVTQLSFQPSSNALPAVNVLDTLATAQVEFFSDGTFTLRYRFEEGDDVSILGEFSRDGNDVSLSVDDGDEEFFRDILLPPNGLDLEIQGGEPVTGLTADFEETYSGETLREFEPGAYEGIPSAQGQTLITLDRI